MNRMLQFNSSVLFILHTGAHHNSLCKIALIERARFGVGVLGETIDFGPLAETLKP